ncbi:tetratricopeptide repeat protein [Erythrobacter sp. THAF29]|uniref:tetratricopeptide repeat protein n=1 Tax=Erythrobacter sp. THAF29 TaxID=2587851 RepID=UPI0012698570|nr:tetratricopeptide repeat protein [Erythrobacter sp. THAF29]QFT76352.1 Putative beta-lactamase HcpC precursor [Erythrobacter sp. THAF29]
MLDLIMIPLLIQLSPAPDEFFEQTYSEETSAAIAEREEGDADGLTRTLERLGEAGDASAYEALGELHFNGLLGIEADPVRGCDYFAKVGVARADALHNLATCYYSGTGREQDLTKARELYVKAAERGWRMSFCAYGNMLVRGEGGPVDAKEGIRLCRMTAASGDADAQTDYGTYLLTGEGIDRDPVAARFILEQAGAQGQRNAAFLLGQIHTRGDGTPVDHRLAGEWFEKAYEWGRPDAAFDTARSYVRRGYSEREGEGIFVDPDLLRTARSWLLKALKAEQPGSERYERVEKLIPSIERLIVSAEPTGTD